LSIAHQTSSFAIEIGINFHGSGEIFMIGFIKKIFAAIFGVLLFPVKLLSSGKNKKGKPAAELAPKKEAAEAFFLEESEAKSVTAPAAKKEETSKKSKASKKEKVTAAPAVAATANALNLPQPTVTKAAAENSYVQFTTRRRPGANMKSYLDMAKTIKNA
jgi:hypothetical protein